MEDRVMAITLDWQEDEAELYRLFHREREGKIRARLQAFWLLRQGKSVQEVVTLSGVSERSLGRWMRWYEEGGLQAIYSHKHGGDHGEKGFLTQEQKAALVQHAAEAGFSTASEAGAWMEEHLGVHYAPHSVFGVLARVGLKRKVPRPRSVKASPQVQKVWKKGGCSRRSAHTR